jgi:hypothetical protein
MRHIKGFYIHLKRLIAPPLKKLCRLYCSPPVLHPLLLQGGLDICEGTSAKWIFDVEIEKLKAEIVFKCREDQNHAFCRWKFLIDRLRPTLYNFIFTFPELAFHDF